MRRASIIGNLIGRHHFVFLFLTFFLQFINSEKLRNWSDHANSVGKCRLEWKWKNRNGIFGLLVGVAGAVETGVESQED
ncbi:hypothetical protein CDL12_03173 [Handroanthus impetiginosus]|uniref:Uncharacterized protein n=1 Tax=Handroanthus impetiginosus TaxID=429701 RepID=A0A2G9I2X5_9LAMI|nr:hypothetical protein CDL12_03173 [Handroanthus impetiginosus]